MPPAARVGDLHACPNGTHAPGPISRGSPTVVIGHAAAARVGDQAEGRGSADTISQGSATVFIEGRPAARAGDGSLHAGVILTGCETVRIGNAAYSGGGVVPSAATGAGGTSPEPGNAGIDQPSGPLVLGKPATPQLLTSLVAVARGIASGGTPSGGLQALATALEVALARGDLLAVKENARAITEALQKAKSVAPRDSQPGPAATASAASALSDPPRSVSVHDGRIVVDGRSPGIHAISEFDLVALQADDRVTDIVERLGAAAAAGRNCVRVFCMYRNVRGELSPQRTIGYWRSLDAVLRRVATYGMVAELVLLTDCEVRPDGTGGLMPSWQTRTSFVRDAAHFLKGRPVIVNGMIAPARNGATGADDPRLVELMQMFWQETAGSVPFSIGEPDCGSSHLADTGAVHRTLASAGASLVVLHPPRVSHAGGVWFERLDEFAELRGVLPGAPALYHSKPMGFASRSELGRRDNDPETAVIAACICAINQIGFCYHHVAIEDPETPGLALAHVATSIPQTSAFEPCRHDRANGPIVAWHEADAPGGRWAICSSGAEVWALLYSAGMKRLPRVEWRGFTPEIAWRGKRAVLWRATATDQSGGTAGAPMPAPRSPS